MMRTVMAIACAATVSTALAAQSGGQTGSSTDRQTSGAQSSQSTEQRVSTGQQMTLTGCVRQTSDQPSTFALQQTGSGANSADKEQMDRNKSNDAATGTSGGSSTASGATGRSGSASASGSNSGVPWYRLASKSAQQLSEYVNKPVRIVGTVAPGKDEKGADIMVHRIEPKMVSVTAIDLKPAPQLTIQSISPGQGTCPSGK